MLTMRDLTGEGFGKKNRDWNAAERLEGWRAAWADHANRALERAGCDERIDHRSLKDQREAARDRGDAEREDDLGRAPRSAERRVGKECVSKFRYRGSTCH